MRPRRFAAAAVGLALAASCSTRPDQPPVSVTSIDPAEGPEGEAVSVQIGGGGFHVVIETDLDDDTAATDGIDVTVGGVPLEQVVLRDETLIEGVVPGTLAVGAHDVVVATAAGESDSLPGGYLVYQRCGGDGDCDDGDPCTTVETCVDERCVNEGADKDADADGFVDDECGGNDCDDDDFDENPGATWYPDGDDDGYGDATAAGNACERGMPSDVANAEDCDDTDPDVFTGTVCDDADVCTEGDTCVLGVCAGIDTCSTDCDVSCASGCGADGCCRDVCTNCPTCPGDCSCDQTCTTGSCDTTCASDAVCRLTASGDSAQLSCASRASCILECVGVPDCKMTCASDALCLVDCGGAAVCDLSCSSGTTVDCGGGILVCHRACP